MTKPERVAMWGLVAGLVVCSYVQSLRTGTLDRRVYRLASVTTSSPPSPLTALTQRQRRVEAALTDLRRRVEAALQANRGLSGPEVRALVETLLPAPGCVEPPCLTPNSTTTAVGPAPPLTASTTVER